MMQTLIHYFFHFGMPLIVAYVFFRNDYKRVYLILLATMLVDLDHLLATPIFSPNRCSINFHPLHSYYEMIVYVAMLVLPKPYRVIGLGLLLHMLTDLNDCVMTYTQIPQALDDAPARELVIWLANRFK
ncbi:MULTISPECIES: DUF6122 family protein [unclassified Psychrobacter]|uniref:DUF6122 family protein n=1 Tax=unclassified Psychrobacter TaxID=196806 RepID=UPI000EE59314|nr:MULTISPECIES: DUF6122 family protein [unclassified Psychrobacter]MCG3809378.1 hypothetical protein [Psychrobacter sp. Ps4]HCI75541.1 hypothetical protein [Psychrobacter sp.]